MTAYSTELPIDDASAKFEGLLASTGAANEFVAKAGANWRAQNGENVADQIVQVTTTGGAGEVIGQTTDLKVDDDSDGTVSAKLRGMVSRLAEILTALENVATLGAIDDAALIGDQDGSINARLRRLMTRVDENAIPVMPKYTFGIVRGGDPTDPLHEGYTTDWTVNRNANDVVAINSLGNDYTVEDFFRGGPSGGITTDPMWIWIPMMGDYSGHNQGWSRFYARIANELGVSLDIAAYAVSRNGPYTLDATTVYQITDAADSFTLLTTTTLADGNKLEFGDGGSDLLDHCQWPIGKLVIKAVPSGIPASGYWQLAVRRMS